MTSSREAQGLMRRWMEEENSLSVTFSPGSESVQAFRSSVIALSGERVLLSRYPSVGGLWLDLGEASSVSVAEAKPEEKGSFRFSVTAEWSRNFACILFELSS